MIQHIALGKTVEERKKQLAKLIHRGKVTLGGHKKIKTYGLLSCKSGKTIKVENRVFFKNEREAILAGFRPCGACLIDEYKKWKSK